MSLSVSDVTSIIKNIRDELDDLEYEFNNLWDTYIQVSEEKDKLEEKLNELGGN